MNQVNKSVADMIQQEKLRMENEISLIASENYAPQSVLDAVGSVLTNKYAEGYPGRRYYAGCSVVDQIEIIGIERLKKLFGTEHANVQPHAGSQANMAAYLAFLQPGDTVLAMDFAAGGHLTHGAPVNFSGKFFNMISYGVDPETECIDYETMARRAEKHKPKMMIAGASAYSRTIDFARCAEIAQSVGAKFMADIAHIAGLIATDLHPSPVPYADVITGTTHKTLRGPRGGFIASKAEYASAIDRAVMPGVQGGPCMHTIAAKAIAFEYAMEPSFVTYQKQVIRNAQHMACKLQDLGYRIVSGGTDNHMFIVDLQSKGVTGVQAERALEAAGINVTRSCIPFDTQKPLVGSGIRLGTPAITTRGMQEKEVDQIVQWIDDVINHVDDASYLASVKEKVQALCEKYPIK